MFLMIPLYFVETTHKWVLYKHLGAWKHTLYILLYLISWVVMETGVHNPPPS